MKTMTESCWNFRSKSENGLQEDKLLKVNIKIKLWGVIGVYVGIPVKKPLGGLALCHSG